MKKDLEWTIEDTLYVIRNVPHEIYDGYDDGLIDMSVAIKVSMLRDLMVENKIPHDVDYEVVKDVEF
ncbi:hypothetical protein [Sporosarcina sp. FSL W7-1283]|uniref:hypothetical protein n=1 Tax=Sporosarcina sp. FSL W7-1283 TaxID=2921560 RepID=UPI0030F9AF92